MTKENPYDLRLTQARALSGQLGLFAEENEIPKDLWDRLESEIYKYYDVNLGWYKIYISIIHTPIFNLKKINTN